MLLQEVDSGVSHGESSDESKSERSVSSTPQPPPAHQSAALLSAMSQHRPTSASTSSYTPSGLQQQMTYCTPPTAAAPAASAVPLLYRPTFLSNYISNQKSSASTKYIPSSQ